MEDFLLCFESSEATHKLQEHLRSATFNKISFKAYLKR